MAQFITLIDGIEKIVGSKEVTGHSFDLTLKSKGQTIKAIVGIENEVFTVAEDVDIHYLSTKVTTATHLYH